MTDVEALVRTLLLEGYALYPYTPGAGKNATPTPFGIVYPPAYAAATPATTFDRLRVQVVAEHDAGAVVHATVLFLEPGAMRPEGVERRVALGPVPVAGRRAATTFACDAVRGSARLEGEVLPGGLARVSVCVDNQTDVPAGLDRAAALRSSLLSTHVVLRIAGGRFLSPVAPPEHGAVAVMTCQSVNTFPVLAADDDTVVLGAAIVLPDHPQLAPESCGDLFDATEIEEALLLHVLALSDGERDEAARQDPVVRAALRRAAAATPEDLRRLHGRVVVRDLPPPAAEAVPGEDRLVLRGVTYRRGDRVRLRPAGNGHDHLHDGRAARIERILLDVEGGAHLAVTLDDDPGADLLREAGRFLYFKPTEVEVLTT
ncbi:MAG TPA: hypothetical protein VD931_21910 [Baekduia sp.]|nr:hypothetical protein [Baekduia sp.]